METWHPSGITGNATDTNDDETLRLLSNRYQRFEDSTMRANWAGTDMYTNYMTSPEDRRLDESIHEYHRRMDLSLDELGEEGELVNGNLNPRESRSTFRSGSELTSDSDFTGDLVPRRRSNPTDSEVFLPQMDNEQAKILDRKLRELPSAKRVADYVKCLPNIPGPMPLDFGNGNAGQVKRQRIWSEGHDRRMKFRDSGSASFAEGMTPHRRITTSSSSNFSQLSSLSSHDSIQHWVDSVDDLDKTVVPSSVHPAPPSPPPAPPPSSRRPLSSFSSPSLLGDVTQNSDHTPVRRVTSKPRVLTKQKSVHQFRGPTTDASSEVASAGSQTVEGGVHSPPPRDSPEHVNKEKPLRRRMTNSELIALASQHRQQHKLHGRRQNLFRMGSSTFSDISESSVHTLSSIDDLLIARHDPEEILLNLGFGGSAESDTVDRIPSRFLQEPSRAHGISIDGFLNQMDELERGCGFSLVGGLRGLGSALHRASISPISGSGLPLSNHIMTEVKGQTREAEREDHVATSDKNVRRTVTFPEAVVIDHESKTTRIQHERGGSNTGGEIYGNEVIGHEEVTEYDSPSPVITKDSAQQTVDGEDLGDDLRRSRGSRARLVLPPSLLPPVDEEAESPLSPKRLNAEELFVSQTNHNNEQTMENDSDFGEISNHQNGSDHKIPVCADTTTSSSQMSSRTLEAAKVEASLERPSNLRLHLGLVEDLGTSRQESFEIEELSSSDLPEEVNTQAQPIIAVSDNRGDLSRSGSTQSDSSGFADEGIGSTETASPHRTHASQNGAEVPSEFKTTQTSFEAETLELLDPDVITQTDRSYEKLCAAAQKVEELVLSRESEEEDSPFDDKIVVEEMPSDRVGRPRAVTFPTLDDKEEKEPGPRNVVEILTSLQTTSQLVKEDSAHQAGGTKKRRRNLRKMKSVDMDCYSYKCQGGKSHNGPHSDVRLGAHIRNALSSDVILERNDSNESCTTDHMEAYYGHVADQVIDKSSYVIKDMELVQHSDNMDMEDSHVREVSEKLIINSDEVRENIDDGVDHSEPTIQRTDRVTMDVQQDTQSTIQSSVVEMQIIPSQAHADEAQSTSTATHSSYMFVNIPVSYSNSETCSHDVSSEQQNSTNLVNNDSLHLHSDKAIPSIPNSVDEGSSKNYSTDGVPTDAAPSANSVTNQLRSSGNDDSRTLEHLHRLSSIDGKEDERVQNYQESGDGCTEAVAEQLAMIADEQEIVMDVSWVGVAGTMSHDSCEDVIHSVVQTEEHSAAVFSSSNIFSRAGSGTRLETISWDQHNKAREELKMLLLSENHIDLTLPESSEEPSGFPSPEQATEDLKLLQRALFRYHQDLEELELWSSQLYADVGYTLSRDEREELRSLANVRRQVKEEVQTLEKSMMERYQSVVGGSTDHLDEDSLWTPNLTQIMCEMVHLLKEQVSLRVFLDELNSTDQAMASSTSISGAVENPTAATTVTTTAVGEEELLVGVMDTSFPQIMTRGELIQELVQAQTDLRRLRIQSKQDVANAVREVRQSIMSQVRRDIHLESQLVQVQLQAKNIEIDELRSLVTQLKDSHT